MFETYKLKANKFGVLMHILAALFFLYGVAQTVMANPQSAPQQTVVTIWQTNSILSAIFCEIVALSNSHVEKVENYSKIENRPVTKDVLKKEILCRFCGVSCKSRADLEKHIKKYHS